jgi:DICT domain-containing protein
MERDARSETAQLAALVDQDVLALTWSLPTGGGNVLTCRLERGTHEPPLTGSLT